MAALVEVPGAPGKTRVLLRAAGTSGRASRVTLVSGVQAFVLLTSCLLFLPVAEEERARPSHDRAGSAGHLGRIGVAFPTCEFRVQRHTVTVIVASC